MPEHESASVVVHVRVTGCPALMDVALAASVTVGAIFAAAAGLAPTTIETTNTHMVIMNAIDV